MKEAASVMTIDFGKNHFNAIYINNQLKLIASNGHMITINDPGNLEPHKESEIAPTFFNFFNH